MHSKIIMLRKGSNFGEKVIKRAEKRKYAGRDVLL